MSLLLATLAIVAVLAALVIFSSPEAGYRGADGRSERREDRAVAALLAAGAVVVLALFTWLLWESRERLDALQVSYVGKRLAWGPETPLTIGGSSEGGREDLFSPSLAPRIARLEPAPKAETGAETAEPTQPVAPESETAVAPGDPVLRLADRAPGVRVNGEWVNAFRLEDGDAIRIGESENGGGGEGGPELIFRDGTLRFVRPESGAEGEGEGERSAMELGRRQVAFLPDVLPALLPEGTAPPVGLLSALVRDSRWSPWRLLLRDAEVTLVRADGSRETLEALRRPVPRTFSLELVVVRGGTGERRLDVERFDTVHFPSPERVEVRFGRPERRTVSLADVEGTLERGLVIPSSSDRRPRLTQLDERSDRFHGLTATLVYDKAEGEARVRYLGREQALEPGRLFALGEGGDQMLLAVERIGTPWKVLADLALLLVFLGVFLGPALRRSPALAALTAAAALLLGYRLLFSHRLASYPPDFITGAYADARAALWVVGSLLVFGWAVGYGLQGMGRRARGREDGGAEASSALDRLRSFRWPLAGLGVAFAAQLLTAGWSPLALIPPGLAALLALLAYGPSLPAVRRRLAHRHAEGWPWRAAWAVAAGAGILAVRWLTAELGAPERFGLPGLGGRILWTVVQLPLCAVILGLACQQVAEDRNSPLRGRDTAWGGMLSIYGFLGLAFALTAILVDDSGLLVVHALPGAAALALLFPRLAPPDGSGVGAEAGARAGRSAPAVAAAAVLALLPLTLVLAGNARPAAVASAVAGVLDETPARETSSIYRAEGDAAGRMRTTTAQRLFRLYMLANPEELRRVGTRPAEQVAVQYATLRGYSEDAGLAGGGFHSSRLPSHLGPTYQNDLMPMAFVLADFGKLGMLALTLTYALFLLALVTALLRARPGIGERWGQQGAWIASAALLAVALPGIYMILANLNLVLFTGKNSPLLALNSLSDVLQSGLLLGLAALGLGLAEGR